MSTAFASGTQSATVTTEHTLSDVNVAGVFLLIVDLDAMVDGDVTEIRAYQMVLTAGTRRVVTGYPRIFYGAQATSPVFVSDPLSNELTDAGAVRWTLKQTFGTSRSYPWKVMQH